MMNKATNNNGVIYVTINGEEYFLCPFRNEHCSMCINGRCDALSVPSIKDGRCTFCKPNRTDYRHTEEGYFDPTAAAAMDNVMRGNRR